MDSVEEEGVAGALLDLALALAPLRHIASGLAGGLGLNDTDIDTAIDTDTGPVKLHIGRFSLELIHLPNLKSKVCTKIHSK